MTVDPDSLHVQFVRGALNTAWPDRVPIPPDRQTVAAARADFELEGLKIFERVLMYPRASFIVGGIISEQNPL